VLELKHLIQQDHQSETARHALRKQEIDAIKIEFRDPKSLLADPNNAKIHTQKQIQQVCRSILRFGFVDTVIIDESGVIISGHGRVQAAIKLGLKTIPTITLKHLDALEKRTLSVTLNQLVMNTGHSPERLRETLVVLAKNDVELLDEVGLDTAQIDLVLDGPTVRDPADDFEEPDRSNPAITRLDDLWLLGPHKLLCGDATSEASYTRLLGGERAQQVVTDPPYNLKVSDIVGLGRHKHAEFAQASGEMSRGEFQDFLLRVLRLLRDHSVDGAIMMAFMDWRSISQLVGAGEACSLELKNICVWRKTNAGMGSLYRSQHEMVAIFKHGTAKHINNVELGAKGRYRTNVWDYAGVNTFGRNRMKDLATHPTVKPLAMIADAIKDCSRRDDIILDCFGGSGTTLLAAERSGRRARLIEIDPYYCDATIQRWQKMTGLRPRLVRAYGHGEAA
jgi:DNA modification methylase